jgi:hypothetical protein
VLRIIDVFEALFLIRQHGRTYFVEDPGLAGVKMPLLRPVRNLVYHELKSQVMCRPELRAQLSEFRTRGGAEVPFIIESPVLGRLAIGINEEDVVSPKTRGGLMAFRKKFREAKLLAIHRGPSPAILENGTILALPWNWLI